MPQWKGLLAACAATLAVTLLITALPAADRRMKEGAGDVSVFRPVPVKRLSSDTIVDTMLGLNLSLKVKKVAWNGSVLTVDLADEEYGNAVDGGMDDLRRLFEFAFNRTDNVSRVLVRFVAPLQPESDEARSDVRVVAAVDVRRTDAWLSTELSNLSAARPFQDEIWRQRLRLSGSQL
ncbi:hypothetical protein I8J29_07785 [Paenibacillus sp. MWE-103]|uniref:Uncharacterized protein n=1 Tax=Paenibacillus artemisiicola TaxID=1172618 RepID=A0ABS3W732_9BACL|nr:MULTISPECIES: hypothetical protein [Paenibacillus]MBO7744088.1 hypothetical protein [Paenibacillus artemisiicola]SFI55887.1 hypothetical protein SAMN02799624_01369 [Paenibacillus sp. UNC496MF]